MQRLQIKFPEQKTSSEKYAITSLLSKLVKPFDQFAIATKTYNRHYENPESQYYHKSVDEIIAMWSENAQRSINLGCATDDYIGYQLEPELMRFGFDAWKKHKNFNNDAELQNHCKAAQKFLESQYNKGYIKFVGREIPITYYDEVSGVTISGRIDSMYYNEKTNTYIIVDYKTADDITLATSPWTSMMEGPANVYPDLKLYKFTFQLHFYQLSAQEWLGKDAKIISCIVQLKSNGEYEVWKNAFEYNKDFVLATYRWAIDEIRKEKKLKSSSTEDDIF